MQFTTARTTENRNANWTPFDAPMLAADATGSEILKRMFCVKKHKNVIIT